MNSELHDKCMNAIEKFLRMRDWNILERNWNEEASINFVAQTKDEDGELSIGFFMAVINENGDYEFKTTKVTRDQAEKFFIHYVTEHPDTDNCHIGFHEISMSIIGNNQAALRLHTNIFNAD